MQLRPYKLQIVSHAHPDRKVPIFARDEQGQRLGETFEQNLLWCVHRQQAHPRDVLACGPRGHARPLQGMAEDLVQGELAGKHLGEPGVPQIQSQARLAARTVEPVGPVGVHGNGLDIKVERRGGSNECTHGGCVLVGGTADSGCGVIHRERAFQLLPTLPRRRVPRDTERGELFTC